VKSGQADAPRSWPPPPLTARPEGLLSSLGIQSGGQYPQHLLADLVPTYELGAWYREYNGTFRTATGALTGQATGNAIDLFTVPDRELWLVRRVGLTLNTTGGAASTYKVRYQVVRTNAANATILPMCEPATVTMYTGAFNAISVGGFNSDEYLLRPTVKLRLLVLDNDGGNNNVPGNGTYTVSLALTIATI